jgi:hypothetical protein
LRQEKLGWRRSSAIQEANELRIRHRYAPYMESGQLHSMFRPFVRVLTAVAAHYEFTSRNKDELAKARSENFPTHDPVLRRCDWRFAGTVEGGRHQQ